MRDTLRDFISFLQFKKREKHPWRSVTFSKIAGFSVKHHMFTVINVPEILANEISMD